MAKTITAANAIFLLSIDSLYAVPQQLQGFSADDVSAHEAMEVAETMMGVDGVLSGGFVNVAFRQTIVLQADSASNAVFDAWWLAQQTVQDLYIATGSITYRSVQTKYALTKGILRSYMPVADAKKTLQPRRFTIEWQSALPAPM